MAELPQSVRDRLAAAQATGGAAHPDSDLLAAFAENALLAGERDRVLAHLAVCPECRTVVALVQPETVPQTVIALDRKRSWFEWKLFRVAGALVAVAVVALAVLLHRPQPQSGFDETSFGKPASTEPQSSPPMSSLVLKKGAQAEVAKRAAATKPNAPAPSANGLDKSDSMGQPAQAPARADEIKEKDAAQALNNEPAPGNVGAMNMSTPAPPPPLLDRSRDKSALPPRANAIGAVLNAERPSLQKAPTPATPTSSSEQITVEAAAEPAPIQQQVQQQKISSQVQTAPLAMRQGSQAPLQHALSAQWRITDGGQLQRFITDQEWRAISPGGRSDFRTVASAGNHVWVGGSSGLFHSSDNGDHWMSVQIGGPDAQDIGEVVSIRMRSADELAVYTASGEVWVTRNGGRTWSRQRK
jgi:hypothetical protein